VSREILSVDMPAIDAATRTVKSARWNSSRGS